MKTLAKLAAIAALVCGATAFAAPLQGEVLEVKDAPPYTYLRLKTADGETWAAVTAAPVKKGERVAIQNPLVMRNFESRSLGRSFDQIVFGSLGGAGPPATAAAQAMPRGGVGAPKVGAPAAAVPVAKIARASGKDARTVAEVVGGKASLKDKPVSLRGQVVKANLGIMGKNWFHVQDGSGSAGAGTHDILVTSGDVAAVGDVVEVKGTVRTDVKVGSGYDYAVLIENATLKK